MIDIYYCLSLISVCSALAWVQSIMFYTALLKKRKNNVLYSFIKKKEKIMFYTVHKALPTKEKQTNKLDYTFILLLDFTSWIIPLLFYLVLLTTLYLYYQYFDIHKQVWI
jgi:hypothetical protein